MIFFNVAFWDFCLFNDASLDLTAFKFDPEAFNLFLWRIFLD